MDIKGIHSIIDLIRDARKPDLIIVSLFLLPVLLLPWSLLLNTLDSLNKDAPFKLVCVVILAVIYVIGLVIMKRYDPKDEQLKRARYHIDNVLRRRVRASFEYLQNEQPKYTPEFIQELMRTYPRVFRPVPIKNHGPGITLREEKAEDGLPGKEAEDGQDK